MVLAGVAQSHGYRVALAQSKLVPLKRAEDVLTMANGPSERAPVDARLDERSQRAPAEARRDVRPQRPPGDAMVQDRYGRQERWQAPSRGVEQEDEGLLAGARPPADPPLDCLGGGTSPGGREGRGRGDPRHPPS